MRYISLTHPTAKHYGEQLGINAEISLSRQKRKEKNLWQRRFWEHLIRDEQDYALHCDYIHYNSVRHGFVQKPKIGNFLAFIVLLHRGYIHPIGELQKFQKNLMKFGTNNQLRSVR